MKLTLVEFHILVSLRGGARHGYRIMQDIKEHAEVRVGPGTLYTAIKRLLRAKLIEELDSDDERRRVYRLTRPGHSAAADHARQLSALVGIARRAGFLHGV